MESYLISEDFWEVVGDDARVASTTNEGNAEAMQRWRIASTKAEFVLIKEDHYS